ncbi:MAG: hypothetical protein GY750_12450 [Lentisphaerae bacterium]|nr:hypothetical protein [Lentisphaerota bacterium]MCP4102223.1 hypothetical protein [Lentisphaerota bacterium]
MEEDKLCRAESQTLFLTWYLTINLSPPGSNDMVNSMISFKYTNDQTLLNTEDHLIISYILYCKFSSKSTKMIPSATPGFYLEPFSIHKLQQLIRYARIELDNFCESNREVNQEQQKFPPYARGASQIEKYAESHIAADDKLMNIIAKAPYNRSMELEFFEKYTYWNSQNQCFEYLPKHIAMCRTALEHYHRALDFANSGGFDSPQRDQYINDYLSFFIDSAYIMLRGIYNSNSTITEAALILLGCMRVDKAGNKTKALTNRGGNLWQKDNTHYLGRDKIGYFF